VKRLLVAGAVVVVGVTACTSQVSRAARSSPAVPSAPAVHDPRTAAALLRVARAFNWEYDHGDYGPVYDRWDARSRAIISRADYIRRRTGCPSARTVARVESARPGPHGAWLVDYEIGGEQLTDYWFYVRGRWVFDLTLSNPDAVKLYRLPPQKYAAAVGCTH
jgi:hypothetical protein